MTGMQTFTILGISGSLRKGSYNTALLREAAAHMPAGATLEIFDLAPLPIFNQDSEHPFPAPVVEFRTRLAHSAALLVATPEYNSSLSALLKNAIDWASRAPQAPLVGKPVGIMGASTGNFGTLRAQLHLRQVLVHVGALPLGKPEVLIARAGDVINAEGQLTDAAARKFLQEMLAALLVWSRKVSQP